MKQKLTDKQVRGVKESMSEEIWKPVLGFEDRYHVSNLGRVKSLEHFQVVRDYRTGENKKSWKVKERILVNLLDPNYYCLRLFKNGKYHSRKVHRLIAQVFIPNPKNKPHINHINGIKTDNRIENLEWVTAKENLRHAWDTGLCKVQKNMRENIIRANTGNNYRGKKVINIKTMEIFVNAKTVAEILKINHKTFCGWLSGSYDNFTDYKYLEDYETKVIR